MTEETTKVPHFAVITHDSLDGVIRHFTEDMSEKKWKEASEKLSTVSNYDFSLLFHKNV